MNSRTILLAVSLLINAGLLVAYLAAPARPATSVATQQRDTGPASATANTPSAAPAATAQPVAAAAAAAPTKARAAFSWATIETTDLDELARRLKAAGFTAQEVRTILGMRISAMTSDSVTGAAKSTPYWRAQQSLYSDPKTADEMRQRMAEQQRLYRKYLGGPESLADDPERIESAKRQWGDLPVEKLQALATIEADYQEMQLKQYAERRPRPGEESAAMDAATLLQKERLADIAKVLTPEEFATYELRAGPTSFSLRFRLESFKPSEDEFKAIFAINKAYEDRFNDRQLSPDARKTLNTEITAKVKDALGAERALDYDAAVNHNSQDQTAGLVSRLGLPARVAVEVRQAQTDFTQRARDIRANTVLSPSERSAQLAALAQQAEAQLTAKLGPDGFEAYNDLKGEWVRGLRPKTGPGGP